MSNDLYSNIINDRVIQHRIKDIGIAIIMVLGAILFGYYVFPGHTIVLQVTDIQLSCEATLEEIVQNHYTNKFQPIPIRAYNIQYVGDLFHHHEEILDGGHIEKTSYTTNSQGLYTTETILEPTKKEIEIKHAAFDYDLEESRIRDVETYVWVPIDLFNDKYCKTAIIEDFLDNHNNNAVIQSIKPMIHFVLEKGYSVSVPVYNYQYLAKAKFITVQTRIFGLYLKISGGAVPIPTP